MRRCIQECDTGLKLSTHLGDGASQAAKRTHAPHAPRREVTKFILIWLCLFAPLSLNEEMKTSATAITKTSPALQIVLSLLSAGLLALALGGCADAYYTYSTPGPESRYNTYYAPYYYPYYPWYSYYGGAYYY